MNQYTIVYILDFRQARTVNNTKRTGTKQHLNLNMDMKLGHETTLKHGHQASHSPGYFQNYFHHKQVFSASSTSATSPTFAVSRVLPLSQAEMVLNAEFRK